MIAGRMERVGPNAIIFILIVAPHTRFLVSRFEPACFRHRRCVTSPASMPPLLRMRWPAATPSPSAGSKDVTHRDKVPERGDCVPGYRQRYFSSSALTAPSPGRAAVAQAAELAPGTAPTADRSAAREMFGRAGEIARAKWRRPDP